jgi:hypothetical protein
LDLVEARAAKLRQAGRDFGFHGIKALVHLIRHEDDEAEREYILESTDNMGPGAAWDTPVGRGLLMLGDEYSREHRYADALRAYRKALPAFEAADKDASSRDASDLYLSPEAKKERMESRAHGNAASTRELIKRVEGCLPE